MSVDIQKVSWNVAEGLIMEISNRRALANSHFIQGNIRKALSTLISIKHSVIQSFNEEERTKLSDIENKFNRISSALSKSVANSFNNKTNEAYKEAMTMAKRLYSKYNDTLMDLLNTYGYLIGGKSDESVMKF